MLVETESDAEIDSNSEACLREVDSEALAETDVEFKTDSELLTDNDSIVDTEADAEADANSDACLREVDSELLD